MHSLVACPLHHQMSVTEFKPCVPTMGADALLPAYCILNRVLQSTTLLYKLWWNFLVGCNTRVRSAGMHTHAQVM